MKKLLSIVLSLVVLVASFSVCFSASAGAINTPQTAKSISLNNAASVKFKYGYPTGRYDSYISENSIYYKFTPSTSGYYEFTATGYEKTAYKTGSTPEVYFTVTDSKGSTVAIKFTNEYTLETKKAAYLYKNETYYIELSDTMYNILSYSQYDYGYAEQTISLKITNHKHVYSVDKYEGYNYIHACYNCDLCDYSYSSDFYEPKTVTLSASSYTYDGKTKKPSVTVKDSNGKKISSAYYTVSYASGCKSVGKYKVKVKFKKEYENFKTLSATFTIKPKGTSVSKLTATKKGFKVTWKKQTAQTSGYQIQYSTNSKFSNAKTVTVSKNGATSKSVTKLSAKKKYYVRVRTYKTVNGTKYYSSWSSSKAVTTKK